MSQSIHFIGDAHFGVLLDGRAQMVLDHFEALDEPAAHVCVGDLSEHGDENDWHLEAIDFMDALPGAVHKIIGNHDLGPAGNSGTASEWEARYGQARNLSVDVANVRLILISPDVTNQVIDPGGTAIQIPDATVDWAAEQAAGTERKCIVVCHAPLRNTVLGFRPSTNDWYWANDADYIDAMLADTTNICAWVSGHTHSGAFDRDIIKRYTVGDRSMAAINVSSLHYVGHQPPGLVTDPVRTFVVTVPEDELTVEVRVLDHKLGIWAASRQGPVAKVHLVKGPGTNTGPPPSAPSNSVAPTVGGVMRDGQIAYCDPGFWDGFPIPEYGFQWQREAAGVYADLSGETGVEYALTATDVTHRIRCVITATNTEGNASATSNESDTIDVAFASPDRVLDETFTAADSTSLAAYVNAQGVSYTKHPTTGVNGNAAITGNRLRMNGVGGSQGTSFFTASVIPPSANYSVRSSYVVKSLAGTQLPGIRSRCDATDNTSYEGRYNLASTRWEINKRVAGVITLLGSFTQTLTVGVTYDVELITNGTAVSLNIDGVERIAPITDSGVTAVGLIGVAPSDSLSSGTGGIHFDSLEVVAL